ncbi:MAG: zinc-dependent metalloprotease [Gemmatimonadales bacterium]|jgi:hypothetical protein
MPILSLRIRSTIVAAAAVCAFLSQAVAQPSIREYARGFEKRDGYLPLYWDAGQGRLLLEIPNLSENFLYLTSLATGVGANAVGLDRGMIGEEAIARFERVGPRVLFVLQNPRFRATTDSPDLKRSVEQSFPTSTVAAFDVLAEEGERVLVDATEYFLTDAMDVAGTLRSRGAGEYQLDPDRSTIYLLRTRAFPINTEVEASLTFASVSPGSQMREHAPDGRAVTLRQHHSFVQIPDDEYKPRRFDPRIGVYPFTFYDYAKSLDQDYATRWLRRHRLIKRDPNEPLGEPVEPIVYYMDRAVPEPYRSAFKEGVAWFAEVFEAAGFKDAFRVEDMPADMDPLDARYNVIQWVHRTEPGSSWGSSFFDPRTGEIIKAAVRMDSHRSLVDYDIYAGALPATAGEGAADPFLVDPGLGEWVASFDADVSGEEFAMARRRQHAAHEVGHTLGLAHNFIAASYGRASVMDYPAPLIRIVNGELDLSDAYRPGPGAYDSLAIRWGYTQFPEGEEDAGLRAILAEAEEQGIQFITNPDEAGASSYPAATTWVNGRDMLEELTRVMEVRRFLMERFDETAIQPGEPMALLTKRFTTVYLHHRFTLGAAIKAIGGMEFRYAVRGDLTPPTRIIAPERQRRALELLLDALEPAELAIPETVLALMAPRSYGYATDRRTLGSAAGPAFDQIGAARTLATMVVRGILHPERAARLVAFADRDPELPTLEEVVGRMIERTWAAGMPDRHAVLRRVSERAVLDELVRLASDADATVEARAGAEWGLRRVAAAIEAREALSPEMEAHDALAAADIVRFMERRDGGTESSEPLTAPSGTPIGGR